MAHLDSLTRPMLLFSRRIWTLSKIPPNPLNLRVRGWEGGVCGRVVCVSRTWHAVSPSLTVGAFAEGRLVDYLALTGGARGGRRVRVRWTGCP